MSHVSGPVSSLPGSIHDPKGEMCDNHPDRPAVIRLQGETDSFGAEYEDLCRECHNRYKAEKAKGEHALVGSCDWCKGGNLNLHPTRDYEEGLCGPVYYVCSPCLKRRNDRLAEEEREWD